jgi:hypothetical protein
MWQYTDFVGAVVIQLIITKIQGFQCFQAENMAAKGREITASQALMCKTQMAYIPTDIYIYIYIYIDI